MVIVAGSMIGHSGPNINSQPGYFMVNSSFLPASARQTSSKLVNVPAPPNLPHNLYFEVIVAYDLDIVNFMRRSI